ncbi:FHA domain-containing protein [Clostridium sp.]|uniref:FHA domain-containing protein n=1 Tax=Clostridium sp. TaxID=1506 RepID=UPI001B5742AE|nr:FHA domain-containing protein [Clostridium sp.]MBP3917434.1 FHA domain-containing protein [Clostridium sp.]
MAIKQCFNPICRVKYREDMEEYELDNCSVCGAPIILIEETSDEKVLESSPLSNEDNNISEDSNEVFSEKKDVYFKVLANGEIVISQFKEEVDTNVSGPRVNIYSGVTLKSVFKLEYDETSIGRRSVAETPDIDLSMYDRKNITSRKHALIYKLKDNYYVRNESSKNSLHVNKKSIKKGEDYMLSSGDLIILSRAYVLEFLE